MKRYEKKSCHLSTGETIAYVEAGEDSPGKKPLVLIHGNYSDMESFFPLIEEMENEYKIYALDLRGFGESTYNTHARSVRTFAKDVVDFFFKKEIKDAVILGWSFGGGVALEAAADLAGRVKGVILLSSISPDGYKFQFTEPITYTKYMRAFLPITTSVFDPFVLFQEVRNLISDRKEIEKFFKELLFNVKEPSQEYLDICVNAILKERNNVDVFEAMTSFNMSKENGAFKGSRRIQYVACPIVQFHGEKDLVIPYLEARQATRLLGKKAKLVTFKNSGHAIINDEPEKLFREIRKFLNMIFLTKEELCLGDQELIG